jgi:hypothetical protein
LVIEELLRDRAISTYLPQVGFGPLSIPVELNVLNPSMETSACGFTSPAVPSTPPNTKRSLASATWTYALLRGWLRVDMAVSLVEYT